MMLMGSETFTTYLFASSDCHVCPLGEVSQQAQGVWPAELPGVGSAVPDHCVQEGSGADNQP